MVKDCPEASRAVATPRPEPLAPVGESLSVPSSASAADGGGRRARSRPPVVREPTRMEEDGP
eukprot:4853334-Prorocentrum_lima.AAC.1